MGKTTATDTGGAVTSGLRALYEELGYARWRVSRFEEYDFYARNRSFLSGGGILTFTDTDGRLMALKPDVTLSIVKSAPGGGGLTKVYYNENVYRAPDPAEGFREIPQMGLECIGGLDLCAVCEVVMLAARSLNVISPDYLLDISHMGLVPGLLADCGAPEELRGRLLELAAAKNAHEAAELCRGAGMAEKDIGTLQALIRLRAPLAKAPAALAALGLGPEASRAAAELRELAAVLDGCGLADRIYLDPSIQCDLHYYNGVVFRGYVGGVPAGVLSGGQYDNLMRRMGRRGGAIGFAVYLDMLERRDAGGAEGVDTLLLTEDGADALEVLKYVSACTARGERVRVDREIPEGLGYRRLVRAGKGGFTGIE